jgi:hypothetical protein
MEHCSKALKEQIEILWHHQSRDNDLDYQFIKVHALAVLQLSEQMMGGSSSPGCGSFADATVGSHAI